MRENYMIMGMYEIFKQLHQQKNPFLLGNVWNASSARIFEQHGYKAIGTSSAAIADSLGYEDGEKISFNELFFIVEKIIAAVHIPLSVDIERGYSDNINEILNYIEKLYHAAVVGINIEDSETSIGQQKLISIDAFSKKLSRIKNHLSKRNMNMFVNARTDAFLLGLPSPIAITSERIRAYENAGADGIFVPFLSDSNSIKKITATTSLPVNVMCMPGLPSFNILAELGVRRISTGNFIFRSLYDNLGKLIKNIDTVGSFSPLF